MSTCKPTTLGELQLYKVLQRANLLSYYEVFISQGGDDVQQLCEAGEEEFLEIMALVGMASKPLHVRRLQKALQEWVTQPRIFQTININYLPAQNIPLTALGIDVRDLMPGSLRQNHSLQNLTNRFGRDTSSAPPVNDVPDGNSQTPSPIRSDLNTTPHMAFDKSWNTNGPLQKSPTRINMSIDDTVENLHSPRIETARFCRNYSKSPLHTSQMQVNGHSEGIDRNRTVRLMESIALRMIQKSPTVHEIKDVILKLKSEGNHAIVSALEGKEQKKVESEIQNFLKSPGDNIELTRHEILVNEAAVKIALADKRFLLKRNELMAIAERVATEVENKLSRRRSSGYLHGSCGQNRLEELNNQLKEIKEQTLMTMKKLSDARSTKSILKENECRSLLERLAKEEDVLLQEQNEINEKISSDEGFTANENVFSSELADLAKAHNLSLGNFQSPTTSPPPLSSAAVHDEVEKSSSSRNGTRTSLDVDTSSPQTSSNLSPPVLDEQYFEKCQSNNPTNSMHVGEVHIKTEDLDNFDDSLHSFPSKPNTAVVRGVKRKHTDDTSSDEASHVFDLRSKKTNSSGNSD